MYYKNNCLVKYVIFIMLVVDRLTEFEKILLLKQRRS